MGKKKIKSTLTNSERVCTLKLADVKATWWKSYTESVTIKWLYTTAKSGGKWIEGSSTTIDHTRVGSTSVAATWTAGNEAINVIAFVKPKAKTYKKGKKTHNRYTAGGKYSNSINLSTSVTPADLDVPTVTTDGAYWYFSVKSSDSATTQVKWEVRTVSYFDTEANSEKSGVTTHYSGRDAVNNDSVLTTPAVRGSRVQVRAIGRNASKQSSNWSNWSNLLTAIPLKQRISCTAQSETAIAVSWVTDGAATHQTYADSWQVQYAQVDEVFDESKLQWQDGQETKIGEGWACVQSVTTGHLYAFRLRGSTSQAQISGDTGYGEWSEIVRCGTGSKPDAPTTFQLYDVISAGETQVLGWAHNCEDNSKSQASRIKFKDNVLPEQVFNEEDKAFVNLTSSDTLGIPDGTEVVWFAATKSYHPDWSDWSDAKSFMCYQPPSCTVSLSHDGDLVDSFNPLTSFPLHVSALVGSPSQKPVSWSVSVSTTEDTEYTDVYDETRFVPAGTVVYQKTFESGEDPLEHDIAVGDVDFDGASTYTLSVTVATDSGLSATSEPATFAVDWDAGEVPEPDAVTEIDESTLTATLIPYCMAFYADSEGNEQQYDYEPGVAAERYQQNVLLSVYRIESDGSFTLLKDKIVNSGTYGVVDPHPALTDGGYRIVATDQSTGAQAFTDTEGIDFECASIVINWDESWNQGYGLLDEDDTSGSEYTGRILELPYNIQTSEQGAKDNGLVQYIGRKAPVSYYGTQQGRTASWSVDIERNDSDTLASLRELQVYMGDCYVREPFGGGYWANVDVSFNTDYKSLAIPVTLDITKVDHDEAAERSWS